MSNKFDSFINKEISTINLHLPAKIGNLAVLLKAEKKGFINRKKDFIEFDQREFQFIINNIPKEEHSRFELPIFLLRRRDLGKGVYVIGGNLINIYVIKKCLDNSLQSFFIWKLERKDENAQRILYSNEYAIIRRTFPTTSVTAIS